MSQQWIDSHDMPIDAQGTGMKYDSGKLRASLLRDFPLAFTEIAKVLTFGANKYAAHSWQDVPQAIERYTDAGDRHELELNAGNLMDEESGCLHEAQVLVNRLFVLELKLRQTQRNNTGIATVTTVTTVTRGDKI